MTSRSRFLTLSLSAALLLVANEVRAEAMHDPMPGMPAMPAALAATAIDSAVAVLVPTAGNQVTGTVRFTRTAAGVRVVAQVSGLTPGDHGFHIHEFGDLTSADGLSAGGHFNPSQAPHGAPGATERHVGDLGNLKADASGHATLDYVDAVLTFDGSTSIIGRGVVVHADADDLKSQPVGNAGKRVATGVIGVAKKS